MCFTHLPVSLHHSDTHQSACSTHICHIVCPIQTACHTQILTTQYITLCSSLQVSCHNGAIPLDSMACSHPDLSACHLPYRILLQPLTSTPVEGPLAGGEHVLVCVWHIHQLLHIQGRAQLEQLWKSGHEDAYWWVIVCIPVKHSQTVLENSYGTVTCVQITVWVPHHAAVQGGFWFHIAPFWMSLLWFINDYIWVVWIFWFCHVFYVSNPSHPSSFDHSKKILYSVNSETFHSVIFSIPLLLHHF